MGLLAVFALVAVSALFGRFNYLAVSDRCGVVRDTCQWQIPLTRLTIFQQSSERETALSHTLLAIRLFQHHEHRWLFVAGGGNGIRCAIGEGRHVFPSAESEGVATLSATTHRFGRTQFRDNLLHAVFDPATSDDVRELGLFVPGNRFVQAADFDAWLTGHREYFDLAVAAHTKHK